MTASTTSTIQQLAQQIRKLERAHQRPGLRDRPVLVPWSLSQWLGEDSWPRGSVIEWLGDAAGAGLLTLACEFVGLASGHELTIVVDSAHEFFAAGLSGLDLRRIIVVRPQHRTDSFWALEQALRTPGVAVVLCAIDSLSAANYRRLQLAAETGGTLGVLLRPARSVHEPSFAEYRILATTVPAGTVESARRRWRLELLRARQRFDGGQLLVELDDDSNAGLRVVSELVAATTQKHAS